MNKLEQKAIDSYYAMWQHWKVMGRGDLETALRYFANDFKGFGSAKHEIWRSQEDMRLYSKNAIDNNSNDFEVDTIWIEAQQISTNLVSLWGELNIKIALPLKDLLIDSIRFTAISRDCIDHMEFIQWHASEPDKLTSTEEVWPGTGEPRQYDSASVLFTDFVGFAQTVASISAKRLVDELNEIFAEFDLITSQNNLEKVKTIGDSYMAVGGLNDQSSNHAIATVKVANEMLQYLNERNINSEQKWDMRIGINSGDVVGGVIGSKNLTFDLWGETVNRASRMESYGEANRINISENTFELIKEEFPCTFRGEILTKDQHKIKMYFVDL